MHITLLHQTFDTLLLMYIHYSKFSLTFQKWQFKSKCLSFLSKIRCNVSEFKIYELIWRENTDQIDLFTTEKPVALYFTVLILMYMLLM